MAFFRNLFSRGAAQSKQTGRVTADGRAGWQDTDVDDEVVIHRADMNQLQRQEGADLEVMPLYDPVKNPRDLSQQFRLGDLHANSLTWIYAAIYMGMLEISEAHYRELVEIYKALSRISFVTYVDASQLSEADCAALRGREQLNRLYQILLPRALGGKATYYPDAVNVAGLIGDEKADRAGNDALFDRVLHAFQIGLNLPPTIQSTPIVVSNHGIEAHDGYEHDFRDNRLVASEAQAVLAKIRSASADGYVQTPYIESMQSMFRLGYLIKTNQITLAEYKAFVEAAYKPSLRLIDYSLRPLPDGEHFEISIFTHAASGLITPLEALARKLGVTYQNDSAIKIAQMIDAINQKFQEDYVKQNRVHELYQRDFDRQEYERLKALLDTDPQADLGEVEADWQYLLISETPDPVDDPVAFLLWNRKYHCLDRPRELLNGDLACYVHGHDSKDLMLTQYCINTDNHFAKSPYDLKGIFQGLRTTGVSTVGEALRAQALVREGQDVKAALRQAVVERREVAVREAEVAGMPIRRLPIAWAMPSGLPRASPTKR